jgi:hypothetical protein
MKAKIEEGKLRERKVRTMKEKKREGKEERTKGRHKERVANVVPSLYAHVDTYHLTK